MSYYMKSLCKIQFLDYAQLKFNLVTAMIIYYSSYIIKLLKNCPIIKLCVYKKCLCICFSRFNC